MPDLLRDQLQTSLGAAYTLEQELGGGGMSRVFLAEDTALGRRVVVKVLSPELAEGLSAERFTREVRLAARLQHPNIVPVLSAGTLEGGDALPYYAMPFIAGASLRARLAEGPLTVTEALTVLKDVARALACAHAAGVVHRDIKPENVLLTGGAAVVADFGIAKALTAAGSGTATLTQVGMAVGTPAYMAPEQAAGETDIDHRADLYAWGLLAWEALAGRHPFAEKTSALALIGAHLTLTPAPVASVRPEVPPALAALVARCLAKDPAARPTSAAEVLRALDDVALTPREPLPAAALAPSAPAAGAPRTLAVLPMANTSGDPDNEHFSDGLTDELIGALSTVPSLRVTGRTSSFALKGKGLGVGDVARTLGVSHVLEGSVRRVGDRMKARMQLVAADGGVAWSEAFDRTVTDVFAVQEEIAQAVMRALEVRLGGERGPLVRTPTADLVAHDRYLRGRFLFRSGHADASRQAIACYEQAIARDPHFAAAHAALAWTYAMVPIVTDLPARDFAPKARAHARRALELDERLAEAHAAMANVTYAADLDVPAAGVHARRALELDPGNVEAHIFYAVWLKGQRHFAQAEAHAARAVAVDPLMPNAHFVLGWVLAASGRPAEALPRLRTAIDMAPGWAFPRELLVLTQVALGRLDDALAECRRAVEVGSRRERALLAYVHALRGERAEARAILDAMQGPEERPHAPPCQMAYAYAALGEADTAIGWIERAFDERDPHVNGLGDHLPYAPLRGDPRFQALLARLRHAPPPESTTRQTPPSIAVLPFANMSASADDAYFADGITEEIINALAHVDGLRVAARTSCFAFKGKDEDLRTVGGKLGVGHVLEGSVRKAGPRLRITAQLIDVASGYHRWSERYDRELVDVFALQDEIAGAIAAKLELSLLDRPGRAAARAGPRSVEAYELLLRGRVLLWQRGRAILDALPCFARAAALDPALVDAHALLGDAYRLVCVYGMAPASETVPAALGALGRALALEPEHPQALTSLANVRSVHDVDIEACLALADRALAREPLNVQALCERALVVALRADSSPEGLAQALQHLRTARRVDPLNAWAAALESFSLSCVGLREDALDAARQAVALDAHAFTGRWALVWSLSALGRDDEALAFAEETLPMSGRNPRLLAEMAAIHARRAASGAVRAILDELRARASGGYVEPSILGCVYAAAGELPEARALVARGIAEHDVAWQFSKSPAWAPFKADPGGVAMLRARGY